MDNGREIDEPSGEARVYEQDGSMIPMMVEDMEVETLAEDFEQTEASSISDDPQFIIISYPDYSKTNPYQDGLYSSFRGGPEVIYGDVHDAVNAANAGSGKICIFHLHWPEPIFAGVRTGHEYSVRAAEFLNRVRIFKSLGGIFVWTIHNRLSHDRKFGDLEIDFHQQLADAANSIHIHDEAALPLINEFYRVDARKCIVVPHGSYVGSYGPAFDKAQCREILGLPRDKPLFVFCGQIRPYKGIDALIRAFNDVSDAHPEAHLLIAGKPMGGFTSAHARLIEESNPNIVVREGFVPDSKIPLIMGAADFIVLPYREILTSGSIMLAATYGKPVITPKLPTLTSVATNQLGLQYDPGDDDGLRHAMEQALALDEADRQTMSRSALAHAARLNWANVSRQLQDAITTSLLPQQKSIYVNDIHRDVQVLRNDTDNATVGIALVYYHSWEDITNLLTTIPAEIDGKKVKTYIFDNSSHSHVNYNVSNIGDVYVTCFDNLGYAAANNVLLSMIREDGCDYAFILNPDVSLRKGALKTLLSNAAVDKVQSPLILNEDLTIGYAGGRIFFDTAGQVRVDHLLERDSLSAAPSNPYAVQALNGCALFIPCASLERLGYIPEDYFLYYEETDWCLNAQSSGGALVVEPRATVIHHKKSKAGNFPSTHYTYYLIRNKFIFSKKWNVAGSEFDGNGIARGIKASFVEPWKKKLEADYPDLMPVFERCVQAALEDGEAGVTGKIDVAARIDAVVLPHYGRSEGQVDDSRGLTLSGWISTLTDDAEWVPGSAWLFKNGSPLCPIVAKLPRPDVEGAGFGPDTGFVVDVPHLIDGEHHHFEVRATSDGRRIGISSGIDTSRWLRTGDGTGAKPSRLRSFIETVAQGRLSGWAADTAHPDVQLKLDVYVNDELIARGLPSASFRQDLLKAGIGNGKHAFSLPIPNRFLVHETLSITVKLAGSDDVLSQKTVPVLNDSMGFSPNFDLDAFMRWSYIEERMAIGHSELSHGLLNQFEMERRHWIARTKHVSQATLVSVIMPVFNRSAIVQDSIRSVLEQSYENFELIIVDDGSTDASVERVREVKDDRIILIELEENGGVSAARNAGLEAARGDVIAYLDSDNLWDPDFLMIMAGALLQHPDHDCAYSGQFIFQNFADGPDDSANALEQRLIRFAPFNRSRMEERNFIDLNVFVHRKSLYEQMGGFDVDLRRLVDWDLIMRYTRDASPLMVPCLLSNYFIGKTDNQITAVEDFISNRSALKIPSPINALMHNEKAVRKLNIILCCQAADELKRWVGANRKLLRSIDGLVLAICEVPGSTSCLKAHSSDLIGEGAADFQLLEGSAYKEAVVEVLSHGGDADLLVTRSNLAVGGKWYSAMQRALAAGDFFAATGRAYDRPNRSRFGDIYHDKAPAKIVEHVRKWTIAPNLQGQVLDTISGDYFFAFGKHMPFWISAGGLAGNFDQMIKIAFGFAEFEGIKSIYTPEVVAVDHEAVPIFGLI